MGSSIRIPETPQDAHARRITVTLLAAVALLGFADVWVHLTWMGRGQVPKHLRVLFDLTNEESLGTWFSTMALAALGVVLFLGARATGRRAFYAAGALFLFLSADDATRFHERIGWMGKDIAPTEDAFAWVQLLGPVFAVLGLMSYLVLRPHLMGRSRLHLQVLAGFGVQGFALLMEFFERGLHQRGLRWRGFPLSRYVRSFEELLELVGPVLLIGAVLAIIKSSRGASLRAVEQDETGFISDAA